MKYKSTDVQKMIDAFANIAENKNNLAKVSEDLKKIVDYPTNVLQEFLKCMTILENKDQDYLKNNYMGVIGYITLRLNLLSKF